MWAVLAYPEDSAAHWAAEGLKARGLDPVNMIDPDELVRARRWEHRVGRGGAYVVATLPDGRVLDSREAKATLNRLGRLPDWSDQMTGPDGDYAGQEMHAFWMGWVRSLRGRVINPGEPRGLGGAARFPAEWTVAAARSGLRVNGREAPAGPGTAEVTMVTVDNRVFGPVADPAVRAGCVEMGRSLGVPLLGIRLVRSAAGWVFGGATPQPDLRLGGERLLDALAEALS